MPDNSNFTAAKDWLMKHLPLLSDVPANKVNVSVQDDADPPNSVAHVHNGATDIHVTKPDLVDQPTIGHELAHVWQNTRNKDFSAAPRFEGVNGWKANGFTYPEDYEYGGLNGLDKIRQQRKTIADMSREQQASLLEHYLRLMQTSHEHGADYNAEDLASFDSQRAGYEPFIKQMESVPGQNAKIDPNALPPSLPAPPGPSSALLGFQDNPLYGPSKPKDLYARFPKQKKSK